MLVKWLYNVDDWEQGFHRKIHDGINSRIFCGKQVMISVCNVNPHTEELMHSHPEEQWGYLVKGEGIRLQGEEQAQVFAGDFWYTPGGVSHGFVTGNFACTILDIFSPPRGSYMESSPGYGNAEVHK